jgi:hypothetical protein
LNRHARRIYFMSREPELMLSCVTTFLISLMREVPHGA